MAPTNPPPDAAASPRTARRTSTRLAGPGAFEAVFEHGLRREGRYVQLVYVPAPPDAPCGRHGFVVGRKVLRRAVDRNRFKRVVRERLRSLRDAVARYDLVIRVKRPVARESVESAAAEAIVLIERLCASQAVS